MKKMKFRQFDKIDDPFFGLFYLMTIGVLLAWVMVTGIIDTTIFARTHFLNLVRVFVMVGLFGLIFRYEVLTKIAFWLFVGATAFVVTGFMLFGLMPEANNIATNAAEIILRSGHYLFGLRPYMLVYERVITWTLIIGFSFLVTYFGYVKFQFWVLLSVLVTTTSIAITSPYFRFYGLFYAFAFCLLTLVVIKSQQLNQERFGSFVKATTLSKLILPLLAVVVGVAALIPTPPEAGADGLFQNIVRAPFTFVNNMFSDLTTQAEFSLATVGFGGNSGRLGGDVSLNDHVFMQVRISPGMAMPLYLTGAVSNTYTGYSWLNLHTDYQPVDFNDFYQSIEVLERSLAQQLAWRVPLIDVVNSGVLVEEAAGSWVYGDLDDETQAWLDAWAYTYRIFRIGTTGDTIQAHISDYESTWINTIEDLSGRALMTINTLNNRTTSLFHTGIIRGITPVGDELALSRTRDGNIVANRRLERETRYRVYHTDLNNSMTIWSGGSSMPMWDRFSTHNPLLHSYRGVLADIIIMLEDFHANYGYHLITPNFQVPDYGVMNYQEILNNFLIPRSEQIHDIYLQLPDTLPERVRELAEEVTANATTNYERMVLLEEFLSRGFDYTLTPGPSPVGQDFVDHFLFDLQQGYCVHFATAFVVMARALGMPTRYVEGFTVHGQRGWNDYIDVLNSMAHAWPEVYFEGYGWVRFEPTPAAHIENNEPIQNTPGSGIDLGNLSPGQNNVPEQPEITEPPQEQSPTPTPDASGNQGSTGVNQETIDETRFRIPRVVWMMLGISMVPIGFVTRIQFVKWKKARFDRLSNHEKVMAEYEKLLRYLQLLGHDINQNETEIAFMQRIKKRLKLSKHEQAVLVVAARIYTKGRYSTLATDDIELAVFAKINARLDERVKLKVGNIRYYWYQNVVGKF